MNILNSIRDDVKSLNNYTAGKAPKKAKRSIKLSSNENRYGSSPKAVDAIRKAIDKGFAVYPDSRMTDLHKATVDFWRRQGIEIEMQNLIFGDGSGEILNIILAGFINKGDRVVIAENSFILYDLLSVPKGAIVIEMKRQSDFKANIEVMAVEANKPKTKIVILANPDNPTATFYNRAEIDNFIAKIPDSVAVIIDEAYIHYAGVEKSAVQLLSKYPNLIITQTFSKAYGLASLRVGYGIAHKDIIAELEKLRLPFNLGVLQQVGAAAGISDDKFLQTILQNTATEKKRLNTVLDELGLTHSNSQANFVFVDLGDDYQKVFDYLADNGIAVRNLASFGFAPNYARITIGTEEDNSYLIECLKQAYTKSGG